MIVIKILLILLTGSTSASVPNIISSSLFLVGLWKVFEKSGIKGWWVLLPGAREYQLARCAGRESEGPVFSLASFGIVLLEVIVAFLAGDELEISTLHLMLLIFIMILMLIVFIYSVRVYSGLCEVYGVRKRWIFLWVLPLEFIPALLWGFKAEFQPSWKVQDIREEMARLASHGIAPVIGEGLTVNLTERSTTEFFQKKVLLRDIHMAIPQGHMVLLLGGSGAGKTTYLNAINGYEKAKAEVHLNGTNMYKQYKKMQYEVGFVPQSDMMRGKDTVLNTLLDAAKLRLPKEVSSEQRVKRVYEVMDIFGLKPVKNNLVEKLSGGQRKRLSISMEFISNPSLFILDEPDSGLDGVMARELFEQLRKIADTGKIVIVITHTPDRVIDLFDDVIVLAKDSARTGRLAYYSSIEDARAFFQREKMEQIVKSVNRVEEGGDGLADEFVMKYAKEVAQHG
ncbi:MAG: ATP-binding cassette domain-containing protein [Clostridia bacterium]|nr:ATP-binding cassette domain-containing protein [Clostridia bacterium]